MIIGLLVARMLGYAYLQQSLKPIWQLNQIHCSLEDTRNCLNCHNSPLLSASGTPKNFFEGGYTRNFFEEGVQQIQLSTEGRENKDLWALDPPVRGCNQFANE
jgi:hypothetical protein